MGYPIRIVNSVKGEELRRLRGSETQTEFAERLGVHANTLQYWVRVYGTLPAEQAETLETLRVRVKELERENQRLTLEREILKKATAFFASQQP